MTTICTNANAIKRFILIAICAFVALHFITQAINFFTTHHNLLGLVRLFNVTYENNLPTLFSTLLLLFNATLLACIYKLESDKHLTTYWLILACIIAMMGVDEFCLLHENLNGFAESNMGISPHGYTHFAWVVPGSMIVTVIFVLFLRFLYRLDKTTSRRFMIAGAVYVAGALGTEMLGADYIDTHSRNFTYMSFVALEESLEMLGQWLFLCALLDYIGQKTARVTFNLNVK